MNDNLSKRNILTYDDVLPIRAGISEEPLVSVRTYDEAIVATYMKYDMVDITGEQIYVRDSLARLLAKVNKRLSSSSVGLKVVYGYRHPAVQTTYFTKRKAEVKRENQTLSEAELDRHTHNFVAAPSVAGHPAGAAVDLTLVDKDSGAELDMGTHIADYSDPLLIQTFDSRVSSAIAQRRLLLHDAMVAEGFAPFYGEWWHFSYGDREWAAFYDKEALYGPIDFTTRSA